MLRQIFIVLFLVCHFISVAQNSAIDSLNKVLSIQKEDSVKAKTLNVLSRELNNIGEYEESLKKAFEAKTLSEKLGYKKGIASGYSNIGNCYSDKGDFLESLKNHEAALRIREEIGDKKSIAGSLNNIGTVYRGIGDFTKALEYFLKSLSLFEQVKNKEGIATALQNIGMVYSYRNEFKKSLDYYKRALILAQELGNRMTASTILSNIGTSYLEVDSCGKTIEYNQMALKIKEEISDQKGIEELLSMIGFAYDNCKDTKMALEYYHKAYNKAMVIGDKTGIAISTGHIADNLFRQGDYNESLKYILICQKAAIESGSKIDIAESERLLSKIYEQKKDGLKAFEHYRNYIGMRDSMLNEEATKKTVRLEMNYQFAKKQDAYEVIQNKLTYENQLKSLEISRKNYFVFGLCALVLVVALIGFLIFRQNKLKSEQKAIQLEQKLLRSQMNPHFIFNALASIESFIYENQPKEAGRYLSDFARLMRLILDNSASEYITLEKEIKTLEYYLSLQKLRLENNLIYTIDAGDNLDLTYIQIPPMLTQPFIENAIEHGFRGSKQTGKIEISFTMQNDNLVVIVKDNGIGINKAKENEKQKIHKSMAMQITKERLTALNKSKKQKLSFSISDISGENSENTGTKVVFSIPL